MLPNHIEQQGGGERQQVDRETLSLPLPPSSAFLKTPLPRGGKRQQLGREASCLPLPPGSPFWKTRLPIRSGQQGGAPRS